MAHDPSKLEITTHDKWISTYPVVLAMIVARGLDVKSGNITSDTLTARSGHYLERMKLFEMLGIRSGISIADTEGFTHMKYTVGKSRG